MNLYKSLASTTIERQVEDIYNKALEKAFPDIKIEYPFSCDGYCEFKIGSRVCRLLVEYKFDEDLNSKTIRSKVLVQVLAYMKKFEDTGYSLPNIVLVADKNECFVLHANDLLKWLNFDAVDWNAAPSSMASVNPSLVLALAEDATRNEFVFDVNEGFDFNTIIQKIKDLALGIVHLVRVTEHNVDKIFNVFSDRIVLERKKLSANDMVALFFNVVTGSDDVYLHPSKNNMLVADGKCIRVDSGKFKAFCNHFDTSCSPKEKARLAAISDRLIEDTKRREQGAFFTPTEWCDYAHMTLNRWLGTTWKDDYVVIDPACGTLNLERDYCFKELYASTLEQSELDIAKNYNSNNCKFAFDFLNGTDEELFAKAPGLKTSFEQRKPIVFFMNPPYATVGAYDIRNGDAHKTAIKQMMEDESVQASELYVQFLWRVMKFQKTFRCKIKIALFSTITFLAVGKFKTFREKFFKQFKFDGGFVFNAGHFQGTSNTWPIAFSMFTSLDEDEAPALQTEFEYHVIEPNSENDLAEVSKKTIWNADSPKFTPLKKWLKKDKKSSKFPVSAGFGIQSFFREYTGRTPLEKILACNRCIGVLGRSTHHEYLMQTALGGDTNDFFITRENVFKASMLFSVYSILAKENYLHDKDIPLMPVLDSEKQKMQMTEFAADSFVFMILGGYDIALRDIDLNGTHWNEIKNEFFFVSKAKIEVLANKYNLDEMYNDVHIATERFAYEKLKTLHLSQLASDCINSAEDLVEKSFRFRKLFDNEHPEYQLSKAWDAGFHQVSHCLKEYMPNEFKEFKGLYRKFAEHLKVQTYQLGFLKT